MPQQNLVEDDTLPTLSDTLDTAESASGASASLYVQQSGTTSMIVNAGSGTITDDTAGATVVEYQFSASESANTGTHPYRWVITYSDGDTESFPKDGFWYVEFDAQLNRGGTVVTPSTSGRAGPIDVLLLNEQNSTPGAPAVDDWGLYVTDANVFRRLDEDGETPALAAYNRTDVSSTSYTAVPWESAWVNTTAAGADVAVTAPADVVDADRVEVGVEEATHNATVQPNAGQSIVGANATLTTVGDTLSMEYKNATSTWMVR